MAIISADGKRLIANGEELEALSKECSLLVDELYEKLSNINKTCWISKAANNYASSIKHDHLQSKVVMNNLINYGTYIKSVGSSIDQVTKKWS